MKICVPIKVQNMSALLPRIKLAESFDNVDMTEIWLDQVVDLEMEKIFKIRKKSMIGVCKTLEEKGNFRGNNFERLGVLIDFVESGGEYVDIGGGLDDFELLRRFVDRYCNTPLQIIGSFHDFEKTPNFDVLEKVIEERLKFGANIIKIATKINYEFDLEILEKCVEKILSLNLNPIVLGMGALGKRTRMGEGVFAKNFLTFAALHEKEKTAEGQMILKKSFI